MKENVDGGSFLGFKYKREIPEQLKNIHYLHQYFLVKLRFFLPRFMNGIVKSAPLSRTDVMVKSVIAKCASCTQKKYQILNSIVAVNKNILAKITPSCKARIIPVHSFVTLSIDP